ncbi:zinc cluster transcription factor, putative [Candida dubliniensis CD36]|uniref:Zinc cluster transcription factor, putative n=1 Tax=Candida dubliniensis (strain CD36 / ATCC MYA-646 / CBS 7987 / NCPF 3949 / NRRL Y-17841) TaxID=573826 RepID=B9W9K7_CANDC|nr:zinc cluster transcription factor, putative [Candida dubliniensis CD36]CAX45491.1 zinc cluster transcription factor, putative [Candida dubliniensis CD36]
MPPKEEKKEKRTKPCCNCKRSKVKCVYTSSLPCERCIKTGQAATCQFVPKLPSLKLPSIDSNNHPTRLPSATPVLNAPSTFTPSLNNSGPLPSHLRNSNLHTPIPALIPAHSPINSQIYNNQAVTPNLSNASDSAWKSQIEQRLSGFDSKIDNLVEMLKVNQQFVMNSQMQFLQQQQQQQQQQQYSISERQETYPSGYLTNGNGSRYPDTHRIESNTKMIADSNESQKRKPEISETSQESTKKRKFQSEPSQDFRDGFLTKKDAHELFHFFDANISQQLFGFEISKFDVDEIWDSCPILVCAISTIASIHHPKLSSKSKQLQVYLHNLCGSIILNKPRNEQDGFNTIVALILCSFWLSDSQMFTGLALQLAKEYGLNQPNQKSKDKLKLWYLLYVLDGQQSLTFNRQPLLNPQEYSLKHSKDLLLGHKSNKLSESKSKELLQDKNKTGSRSLTDKEISKLMAKQRLTDMRLVSQVEYNQAINEAFKGTAWDLLAPASFGIPSKSNLELDRWMVSWTVLLSPESFGAIWSTKSTLIYYNFAKMHINSSAVRKITLDPNNGQFPKLDTSLTHYSTGNGSNNTLTTVKKQQPNYDSEESSEDEFDENEFISNKELVSPDEAVINANIALNAAQTVLNLVINDKDILDNLKYVPVHIHIMLYYASLLLINPPKRSNNQTIQMNEIDYYDNLLNNLKVVRILQRKIYMNLPIDSSFGNRLIKNLQDVLSEKLHQIQVFVDGLSDDHVEKHQLRTKVNALLESSENKFEEITEYDVSSSGASSKSTTPLPERISAWPGSNHGHP